MTFKKDMPWNKRENT